MEKFIVINPLGQPQELITPIRIAGNLVFYKTQEFTIPGKSELGPLSKTRTVSLKRWKYLTKQKNISFDDQNFEVTSE